MRFLIIGDLHGQIPKIPHEKFDAIIAPGDFCSDDLKKYHYAELKLILEGKPAKRWYDLAGRANAGKLLAKSIADGRKILERLNSIGVPVYVVPGNWDWTPEHNESWKILRKNHYLSILKGLKNIHDTHYRIVDAKEAQIIGHGITAGPEFPQTKKEMLRYSKKGLAERKKNYASELKHMGALFRKARKPVILLSHNVPYNTPLDKIDNPHSPRNGEHFGSAIARDLIKLHNPLACIGGHMHEHFGQCKIGKTTVINSGFGPKVSVILEVQDGKINKLRFTRQK